MPMMGMPGMMPTQQGMQQPTSGMPAPAYGQPQQMAPPQQGGGTSRIPLQQMQLSPQDLFLLQQMMGPQGMAGSGMPGQGLGGMPGPGMAGSGTPQGLGYIPWGTQAAGAL